MSKSRKPQHVVRQRHTARTLCRRLKQVLGIELNVHHERYPKPSYKGDWVKQDFRNLHCQRIITPINEHNEHHHSTAPPVIPTRDEMLARLNACANRGCTKQGCTQPIRILLPEVPIEISLPREVIVIASLT